MFTTDAMIGTDGEMQASYNNTSSHGYMGPCPKGAMHTYQFEVYALSVAMVPNLTASSSAAQAKTQIAAYAIATGTLSGTSSASPP
jgi:phosphatidylethanolamine-binding protein (PEBP) family uncharacterized protein